MPVTRADPPAPSTATALAWSPSRVPASVVAAAKRLTGASVAEVANGTVWLAGKVWSIPIDVAAADPARYAAAVPAAAAIAGVLRPGTVVLAADEARLRQTKVGEPLRLGGHTLRVVLIVPDAVIGDAEMLVTQADGTRLGLPPDRYLLIRPAQSTRWAAESAALRRADPATVPLRLVSPGKARRLREADAVLSPLEEKLRFGEFGAAARATGSGELILDPTWVAAHISTASVPILGQVTCNQAFLPALRSGLGRGSQRGPAAADRPRRLRRLLQWATHRRPAGSPISHHAYGSAIDLNVRTNLDGAVPHQDPRLVRIFARYGLTWGGRWLVPDGMHFEALTKTGPP